MELKDLKDLTVGSSTACKIATAKITELGNGSFKTKKGTQLYHCPKTILESANIKGLADITFPLYCYATVKEITPRNPNAVAQDDKTFKDIVTDKPCNEFMEQTVPRAEITAIFKTKEDFFAENGDDDFEQIEYADYLKKRGKTAGLDEEMVNRIANASVPL